MTVRSNPRRFAIVAPRLQDGWRLFSLPLAIALVLSGCHSQTAKPESKTDLRQQSAQDVLESAVYQLQPENLGIDSDVEAATGMLNSWKSLAVENPDGPPIPDPKDLPPDWLPAEAKDQLASPRFVMADAEYLRTCFMLHEIAGRVASQSDNELQKARLLFEYVCRNIALVSDPLRMLPQFPYEILLTGRGTAEDRAWILGLLLKQARIDAVIVRPTGAVNPDEWLFGIPIEGKVYLFDLRLGMAIPSSDAPTAFRPEKPATLDEIAAHPSWLTDLAPRADQPYPITAEQLAKPQIEAISDFLSWPRRMWDIEQVLPGDKLCVLYDALGDSPAARGLPQRLKEAGVPVDGLKLWAYPQQQTLKMQRIPPEQLRELMAQALAPMLAPFDFVLDQTNGRMENMSPTRKQQLARTEQLLGHYDSATRGLLGNRLQSLETVPDPLIQRIHQVAGDDAHYWSALCKYETGEIADARTLLQEYLRRTQGRGRWSASARLQLALAFAEEQKWAEALEQLNIAIPDDPYREANVVWTRQWKKLQEQQATPTPPAAPAENK